MTKRAAYICFGLAVFLEGMAWETIKAGPTPLPEPPDDMTPTQNEIAIQTLLTLGVLERLRVSPRKRVQYYREQIAFINAIGGLE